MKRGEIEIKKNFSDIEEERIRHEDILDQNEKFHKERLAQQDKFNQEKLKIQKSIEDSNEKRYQKTFQWNKYLVIANIVLVIFTILMALASIWTASETRRLANAEILPNFDVTVSTIPDSIGFNNIYEMTVNKKLSNLTYYLQIYNDGKVPINIKTIYLESECFGLPDYFKLYNKLSNESILNPGQKVIHSGNLSKVVSIVVGAYPCEVEFKVDTTRNSKSAKLILR